MNDTERGRNTIKSDETLLTIVDALHSLGTAGVTELSEAAGRSKGTVHKHLATLERHGWVVNTDGRYRLGLKFLTYGGELRDETPLYRAVAPKVREIADESGEACGFSIMENSRGVQVDGDYDNYDILSTLPLGASFDLHANAVGKAMLAELSDEDIRDIVDSVGLSPQTPNTITDIDSLFDDIEQVREDGFALNVEEQRVGWNAVAVAVSHPETDSIGALSIAGPSQRLTEARLRDHYADILLTAVNEVYLQIEYE